MTVLPVFVGVGTFASSSITPVAGTVAGDFMVLVCHTSNQALTTPSGWNEFPDSPQGTGTAASAGAVRLQVYWRRATSDAETISPTNPGNHIFGQIYTFRGIVETGNPYDVTSGGVTNPASTSVSITGDTTTVDNCYVLAIVANAFDGTGDQASSWANSDLSGFAQLGFGNSATGTGGGFNVAGGGKATAGTYGTTTATLANSSNQAWMTIALKPAVGPWFFGRGTLNGNIGPQQYSWSPSGAYGTNDIGILLVETANEAVTTPSSPAGWVEITNSPQGTGTGGAAGATRLTAYWKRATSGSETDVTVPDPGDHHVAVLLVFRNCVTTGDPWDVTSGNVKAVASTSTSIGGVTTTVNNCLIIYATTRDNDLATANWSSWANATVGANEIVDAGSTAGNGGGFGVATGFLATAGATGTTTATSVASTVEGYMCIALKPSTGAAAVTRFYASIVG